MMATRSYRIPTLLIGLFFVSGAIRTFLVLARAERAGDAAVLLLMAAASLWVGVIFLIDWWRRMGPAVLDRWHRLRSEPG